MKKIFSTLFIIPGIVFLGCNSATTEQNKTQQPDPVPVTTPASTTVQPVLESAPAVQQVPAQQTSAPATDNPYAGLTGMNPAHGQPGHRCDISVGAPLNSPPGNKATSTPVVTQSAPTISTTPVTIQPTAAPTVTAPGMNPPHGQPGHDCSVAVGAPLKK